MKTIIHVAQAAIAQNRKEGTNHPPLIRRDYKSSERGHTAEIWADGKLVGRFVHRPHDPLPCGARVWFETENEVRVNLDQDPSTDLPPETACATPPP